MGVRVRYGRPRRGEMADPFREQIAWAFGVPGSWSALDVASVDVNMTTAELTFPENFLGLNYNEVEVTYTSGLATIPAAVKVACAQIVKNAQATPAMNVKSSRMDRCRWSTSAACWWMPRCRRCCGRMWRRGWGDAMADLLMNAVAVRRAANVLLRGVGGRAVMLRMPAPAVLAMSRSSWGWRRRSFRMWSWLRWCCERGQWRGERGRVLVSATAVKGLVGSMGYSAGECSVCRCVWCAGGWRADGGGVGDGDGAGWVPLRLSAGVAGAGCVEGLSYLLLKGLHMQNAKDTFYVTLRDRLAAVNPARTMLVRGVIRPGLLVEENELASAYGSGGCVSTAVDGASAWMRRALCRWRR